MVVDPLRASYTVPGVTALEMVKYFYDVETRLDWDGTVESVEAIEKLAEDTVVFHQLHKRVWPSVQRESLFCSHLCLLTDAPCPDNMVGDTMMVCNFSVDHDKVPVSLGDVEVEGKRERERAGHPPAVLLGFLSTVSGLFFFCFFLWGDM